MDLHLKTSSHLFAQKFPIICTFRLQPILYYAFLSSSIVYHIKIPIDQTAKIQSFSFRGTPIHKPITPSFSSEIHFKQPKKKNHHRPFSSLALRGTQKLATEQIVSFLLLLLLFIDRAFQFLITTKYPSAVPPFSTVVTGKKSIPLENHHRQTDDQSRDSPPPRKRRRPEEKPSGEFVPITRVSNVVLGHRH